MTDHEIAQNKIKSWVIKNHVNNVKGLRKIHTILLNRLASADLQQIVNECNAISIICSGDGAGLTSGSLTDMYISAFLKNKILEYEDCHKGEADMIIDKIPISFKK